MRLVSSAYFANAFSLPDSLYAPPCFQHVHDDPMLLLSRQGTAKLHYVTVRVFRTLLSKGLCSDESEEGEGEGDGDIDGMKVTPSTLTDLIMA